MSVFPSSSSQCRTTASTTTLNNVGDNVSDNHDDALPDLDANYTDSDDEDNEMEDDAIHPRARRSKRVMQQMRQNERGGLHRIASLAAREQAALPDLTIKHQKLTRGWSGANLDLQLNERAYVAHFAGSVIDETCEISCICPLVELDL